jgi:hypothetical protein
MAEAPFMVRQARRTGLGVKCGLEGRASLYFVLCRSLVKLVKDVVHAHVDFAAEERFL